MNETIRRALPLPERDTMPGRSASCWTLLETPAALRDRKMSELSGGWQRLALIARAWVSDPDVLLLDEPTNHLDGQRLGLLENWINHATDGVAMVIASHDRQFLDTCTNRTLFLRPEDSQNFRTSVQRGPRAAGGRGRGARNQTGPRRQGSRSVAPKCRAFAKCRHQQRQR